MHANYHSSSRISTTWRVCIWYPFPHTGAKNISCKFIASQQAPVKPRPAVAGCITNSSSIIAPEYTQPSRMTSDPASMRTRHPGSCPATGLGLPLYPVHRTLPQTDLCLTTESRCYCYLFPATGTPEAGTAERAHPTPWQLWCSGVLPPHYRDTACKTRSRNYELQTTRHHIFLPAISIETPSSGLLRIYCTTLPSAGMYLS